MNTLTHQPNNAEVLRKTNKLLLTAYMLFCVTTGWFLGSITTQAFSQSGENNIILHSVPLKGESLPTVILKEFCVVADQEIKNK